MRSSQLSIPVLLFVGLLLAALSVGSRPLHAQDVPSAAPSSAGAEIDKAKPKPKLTFPQLLTGSITFTRTRSYGGETLKLTWSGNLEMGRQDNEVPGPLLTGYGLGGGTFKASGGGRTDTDTWTYSGHVLTPYDREHLSIYFQGSPTHLQARVGVQSVCTVTTRTSGHVEVGHEIVEGLMGTPATVTSATLRPGGVLSVAWNGTTVSVPPYTFTISGKFQGKGTWGLVPDENPVPFVDKGPAAVTVRALGLPANTRITWRGVPKGARYLEGKRIVQINYTQPGKYTLSAVARGHTEKVDVYVVQVKFPGTLVRPVPEGEAALPKSVSPGKTGDDRVEITPDLSKSPYTVDLDAFDGDDSQAGSATVEPAQVAKSGPIKIQGVTQTEPGHQAQLRLRARVNGDLAAEAETKDYFSVCAHPTSVTFHSEDPWAPSRDATTGGGDFWGAVYHCEGLKDIKSDSDNSSDLGRVQVSEFLDWGHATLTGFYGASGHLQGTYVDALEQHKDRHVAGNSLGTAVLLGFLAAATDNTGDAGDQVVDQTFRYRCPRCGAEDALVPNSGFHIEQHLTQVTPLRYFMTVLKAPQANNHAGPGEVAGQTFTPLTIK